MVAGPGGDLREMGISDRKRAAFLDHSANIYIDRFDNFFSMFHGMIINDITLRIISIIRCASDKSINILISKIKTKSCLAWCQIT